MEAENLKRTAGYATLTTCGGGTSLIRHAARKVEAAGIDPADVGVDGGVVDESETPRSRSARPPPCDQARPDRFDVSSANLGRARRVSTTPLPPSSCVSAGSPG